MSKYFAATYKEDAFHCPTCATYANQRWYKLYNDSHGHTPIEAAQCARCYTYSFWIDEKLIHPAQVNFEMPSDDMPDDCMSIFQEARAIANKSPRGAAALLRLCLQRLMVHLGEPGKNINHDIGSLVKKGLPDSIKKAADICRIVGNNSVHPGIINIDDDEKLTHALFALINIIVNYQITKQKEIDELFNKMPENAKEGIEERDRR